MWFPILEEMVNAGRPRAALRCHCMERRDPRPHFPRLQTAHVVHARATPSGQRTGLPGIEQVQVLEQRHDRRCGATRPAILALDRDAEPASRDADTLETFGASLRDEVALRGLHELRAESLLPS